MRRKETHALPSSLLTKGCTLKGSKSSVCSPVPMKTTGLLVAATLYTQNIPVQNMPLNLLFPSFKWEPLTNRHHSV